MIQELTTKKNNGSHDKRPERLKLSEKRDIMYEKFRTNLRLLRASDTISAVELSQKLELKNGKRLIDLEYGRGNPTLDELYKLTKYFNVTMDEILNKNAVIKFEP